jgi:hypothetical protein
LQVGAQVKADIQNAVNAGKEVTVSKTNITYSGWTGCGYIVINPQTGAGAYMISGGLSGACLILLWVSLALLAFALMAMFPSVLALILINVFISVLQVTLSRIIKGWDENPFTLTTAFTMLIDALVQITLGAVMPGMPSGFVSGLLKTLLQIEAAVVDWFIFFFCRMKMPEPYFAYLDTRGGNIIA